MYCESRSLFQLVGCGHAVTKCHVSVGGVFDPFVSSATAVFERDKDELELIPCLLLVAL